MESNNVDISVHMITYNHYGFIKEAIEGVLMQKCNYSFELVIGEDFSTDTTRQICEEYAEKYPDIIRLLPSTKNWGVQKNFFRTYEACRGKYLAFCEGDDFWTDPNKLQLQVSFLQENKDYSGVSHNASKLFVNWNTAYSVKQAIKNNEDISRISGIKGSFNEGRKETEISFLEILDYWPIQTGTFFCRKFPLEEYPSFIYETKHVDTMLFFTLWSKGKIKYINKICSTYRVHENGMTNFMKGVGYYKNKIKTFESLDDFFEFKYKKLFKSRIVAFMVQISIDTKNNKERLSYLFKAIKMSPSIIFSKWRIILSLLRKGIING